MNRTLFHLTLAIAMIVGLTPTVWAQSEAPVALAPLETFELGPELEGYDPETAALEFTRTRALPYPVSADAVVGSYERTHTELHPGCDFTAWGRSTSGSRLTLSHIDLNEPGAVPLRLAIKLPAYSRAVAGSEAGLLPGLSDGESALGEAIAATLLPNEQQMRVYYGDDLSHALEAWVQEYTEPGQAVLYLYFAVAPESDIASYRLGEGNQPAGFTVPDADPGL